MFICDSCGARFSRQHFYQKHIARGCRYNCDQCTRSFSRKATLRKHQISVHENIDPVYVCGVCTASFSDSSIMREHRAEHFTSNNNFHRIQHAHNYACELFKLVFPPFVATLDESFAYLQTKLVPFLDMKKRTHQNSKVTIIINLKYTTDTGDTQEEVDGENVINLPHRSVQYELIKWSNPSDILIDAKQHIENSVDSFMERGSGWVISDVMSCDLELNECATLNGGCDIHVIKSKLVDKTVSVTCNHKTLFKSNLCFYYAVARHFLPDGSKTKLGHFILSNMKCVDKVPVGLKDIKCFEDANQHLDMSINVMYQDEDKNIIPIHASKRIHAINKINLLLVYAKTDNPVTSHHYAYIRDLKRLIAKRSYQDEFTVRTWSRHLCYNCFSSFSSVKALEHHVAWCHTNKAQKYVVPKNGDKLKFEVKGKSFESAYVAFFDFEAMPVKTSRAACTCVKECKCKTKVDVEHKPFCYSAILLDRNSNIKEKVTYTGEDAALHFLHEIFSWRQKYLPVEVTPMQMTENDIQDFEMATKCHVCELSIENDDDKVRDHDHLTGKYVGAAHSACNLKRKETNRITAFAHNFSGYDSHFLVKELKNFQRSNPKLSLKTIPLNQQKFKMLEMDKVRFLDSFAFLSSSLDTLTDTLVQSNHNFNILKQWQSNPRLIQLLLRKGIYPYEFVKSIDQLKAQTSLPKKNDFYSKLNDKHISEEDYAHAQNVWKSFGCSNMIEYTEMYVTLDVLLLAESVMDLRRGLYDEFNLDMCHFFSLPMIAKDIMLKTTGVELDLMSDLEMIHFVKDNIRGGLSYVNTRYFHKDVSKGQRTAFYVDANNLVSLFTQKMTHLCGSVG